MDPRIGIQVFNEFEDLVSLEWLERVAECTLSLAAPRSDCKGQECPAAMEPGADGAFTLGVVIADDDTVHRLNSQHRGLDEITDVLSFSFSHQGAYYGAEEQPPLALEDFEFVIPPQIGPRLGEVIISFPQAARQAEESDHGTSRELAILLAHGVLHLLGYDHEKADDEAVMKATEALVLAQVYEHE